MMRMWMLFLLCLLPAFAHAGEAKDLAEDPVLEKRMIGLAEKLRCLVCQNESLASSHAELAEDLRREVREQMRQNKSDQESIDYLVARYGQYVPYDPPKKRYALMHYLHPFPLPLREVGVLLYQMHKRRHHV